MSEISIPFGFALQFRIYEARLKNPWTANHSSRYEIPIGGQRRYGSVRYANGESARRCGVPKARHVVHRYENVMRAYDLESNIGYL